MDTLAIKKKKKMDDYERLNGCEWLNNYNTSNMSKSNRLFVQLQCFRLI